MARLFCIREGILSNVIADDAEASCCTVILNDSTKGALSIISHQISLIQHNDFEVRARICPE